MAAGTAQRRKRRKICSGPEGRGSTLEEPPRRARRPEANAVGPQRLQDCTDSNRRTVVALGCCRGGQLSVTLDARTRGPATVPAQSQKVSWSGARGVRRRRTARAARRNPDPAGRLLQASGPSAQGDRPRESRPPQRPPVSRSYMHPARDGLTLLERGSHRCAGRLAVGQRIPLAPALVIDAAPT